MRRGAPSSDGVILVETRRRKERTCPQLYGVRQGSPVRLGSEVVRVKRKSFCALAVYAQSAPHFTKFQAEAAWLCRWASILWCASAASFSQPLLAVSGRLEADGTVPSAYERKCVLFRVAYVWYVRLSYRSRLENILGSLPQLFHKRSSPPSFQSPFLFVPRSSSQSPLRQTYHVDAVIL